MARVILDVPSEKMSSFVRMVMQLGIDKHSISSDFDGSKERSESAASPAPEARQQREREGFFSGSRLRSFTSKLFDWDRNRNELEFE